MKRSGSDYDEYEGTPSKKIKLEPGINNFEKTTQDETKSVTETTAKAQRKKPFPLRDDHVDLDQKLEKKSDRVASMKNHDSDDPLANIDLMVSLFVGSHNRRNSKKTNVIMSKPFFCRVNGRKVKVVVVYLINRPMLWYIKVAFITMSLDHIKKMSFIEE